MIGIVRASDGVSAVTQRGLNVVPQTRDASVVGGRCCGDRRRAFVSEVDAINDDVQRDVARQLAVGSDDEAGRLDLVDMSRRQNVDRARRSEVDRAVGTMREQSARALHDEARCVALNAAAADDVDLFARDDVLPDNELTVGAQRHR